jgi:hypothetical protein
MNNMTTPSADTRPSPDDIRNLTANWTLRREIGNALGYTPSPYYAWAYLDGDKWREYPAWDVDANLALQLIATDKLPCDIMPQMDGTFYVYVGRYYQGRAETPALAICQAYLAYTTAQPPQPADGEA